MKELIKNTILTFVLVVVGITVSATIFLTLFYPDIHLSAVILKQIILMSFICSLGNIIFYAKYELGKQQMLIRKIIHFLYINLIVISGAIFFEWVATGRISQFVVLFIMIELVYLVVMLINIQWEKKEAKIMNQRLGQINGEDMTESLKVDNKVNNEETIRKTLK